MNLAEQLEDARAGSAAAQKALFDHFADSMMALCCHTYRDSTISIRAMQANGLGFGAGVAVQNYKQ